MHPGLEMLLGLPLQSGKTLDELALAASSYTHWKHHELVCVKAFHCMQSTYPTAF